MATRIDLFYIFVDLLSEILETEEGMTHEQAASEARKRVFFEAPPETVKLSYPCIIYARKAYLPRHADNLPYTLTDQYDVTAIYKDPDSTIGKRIAGLSRCRHNRHYTADNLQHDAFTINY